MNGNANKNQHVWSANKVFYSIGLKDRFGTDIAFIIFGNNNLKAQISLGKRIYYHLEENNCQDSIFVKNNLMKMYCRCECLDEAIKIFNSIKISERDLISCTTMIIAYGQNGKGKASELFEEMQKQGIQITDQTIAYVSKACCDSDLISNAAKMFFLMESKLGFEFGDYHYNCMLNRAQCNYLDDSARCL
jgi:pentatricopeptide repeat protein